MNRKHFLSLIAIAFLLVACGGQASAKSIGDPVEGKLLFSQAAIREAPGCNTCHSVELTKIIVGPSLSGISLRAAQRIPDKTAVEYLRESIINPNAYVVDGFSAGVMYQHFKDVLNESEVNNLIAFLLTLE